MKKIISAIAVGALCVSSAAHAERNHSSQHSFLSQHSLRLGVDSELAVPLGNYSDVNSVGGGLFLNGELAMTDLLSATARIGFQAHMDRSVGAASSHVNAIPFMLGGKYYLGGDRQGIFAALEAGMFDLMNSRTVGTTSTSGSDLKFGMGVGLGIQQSQWNAKITMHTQDVGNFGDAVVIAGGIGYQFGAL